jgi:hypothetical protein
MSTSGYYLCKPSYAPSITVDLANLFMSKDNYIKISRNTVLNNDASYNINGNNLTESFAREGYIDTDYKCGFQLQGIDLMKLYKPNEKSIHEDITLNEIYENYGDSIDHYKYKDDTNSYFYNLFTVKKTGSNGKADIIFNNATGNLNKYGIINFLLVGGGGSGGHSFDDYRPGSGGSAGIILLYTNITIVIGQSYTIEVGTGAPKSSFDGDNGSSNPSPGLSRFGIFTASGGTNGDNGSDSAIYNVGTNNVSYIGDSITTLTFNSGYGGAPPLRNSDGTKNGGGINTEVFNYLNTNYSHINNFIKNKNKNLEFSKLGGGGGCGYAAGGNAGYGTGGGSGYPRKDAGKAGLDAENFGGGGGGAGSPNAGQDRGGAGGNGLVLIWYKI